MSKWFGTDGIRQKAEQFTPEFLHALATGLVEYGGVESKILLGGDTRESTEWILRELEVALESLGVEYGTVGVLPTPAINYVFFEMGFDFAIDVTASHNPYTDNGIKIFERGKNAGQKLSEQGRELIEKAIDEKRMLNLTTTMLREDLCREAEARYIEHLKNYVGAINFAGLKIGMDCANGATSRIGAKVFTELGAEVKLIHADAEYGRGINKDCGSTHLEDLTELVVKEKLDFGVAFDGDGDRVLMVDENGEVVDGDEVIVILAENWGLKKLAVTVMANQGLLDWAKQNKVELEITAVGDQNVAAAMREHDIKLGGEQSGHIILPNEATGDGILTALVLAKIMSQEKRSLGKLKKSMTKFPQVIYNLPATKKEKEKLRASKKAEQILRAYDQKLAEKNGRMLVRPSGTEELMRITMWGKNAEEIQALAKKLAEELKEVLA